MQFVSQRWKQHEVKHRTVFISNRVLPRGIAPNNSVLSFSPMAETFPKLLRGSEAATPPPGLLFLSPTNRNPNPSPDPQFLPFSSCCLLPALTMSNLRAICRPYAVISSVCCCRGHGRRGFAPPSRNPYFRIPSPFYASSPFVLDDPLRLGPASRTNPRRTITRVSYWKSDKSPYETLELERDADEEKIKAAYRRLAKFYHPDVYDGRGTLEEGETAEARFIKIQAAYELLIDDEKRRQYDSDHRVNPRKASQAWMEWLMKKRKAFNQRGDMAIAAWAEQQQRELTLRARRLSRSKIDPEEERKLLAKEKKASVEYFNNTLKRHTLVLRRRDLMRRRAEEEKKDAIIQLLAAEGLELDTDEDDEDV